METAAFPLGISLSLDQVDATAAAIVAGSVRHTISPLSDPASAAAITKPDRAVHNTHLVLTSPSVPSVPAPTGP